MLWRPQNQRAAQRRSSAFMFSNPVTSAILQILGALSAIVGIWGYLETRQTSQITYSISHETIYRPSKAIPSELVLPSGKNAISTRVVQSVITIWNGGNVALKGEDTRQKLTLTGDSSVDIIGWEVVVSKSLPGSSGFSVKGDSKSVVIDWRNFDPGEGLQIVVLSTGNAISLGLSGRFLPGQKIVRGPIKSLVGSLAWFFVFFAGAFILVAFVGAGLPLLRRTFSWRIVRIAVAAVASLVLVFAYAVTAYRVLYYARSFVGDVSPIDPYPSYIDIDRKLDYRPEPM